MSNTYFRFKQFTIQQADTAMKVNTDGVLLGAWADVRNTRRVLDVGTGTGVIALMVAQRNAGALVDAIEIDDASAAQAEENVRQSAWRDRIQVTCVRFQDFAPQHLAVYDMVISNPPYFINSLLPPETARAMVRHAEQLPQDALIEHALQVLKPEGCLCVILPYVEGTVFVAKAAAKGLFCVRKTNVRTADNKPVKRLLMTFTRTGGVLSENTLSIHSPNGIEYTGEYRQLTSDFYLNF